MNLFHRTVFLAVLSVVSTVTSKRILMMPVPTHSHIGLFTGFGAQLVQRGHEVHVLINAAYDVPQSIMSGGMNVIKYKCGDDLQKCGKGGHLQKHVVEASLRQESVLGIFHDIGVGIQEEANSALLDDELFDKLAAINFDIAIIDGLFVFRAFYLIPHRLSIPTITLSDTDNDSAFRFRLPLSPSYVPNQFTTFTEHMSLPERTVNFMLNWILYFYQFSLPPPDNIVQKYQQYGRFKSPDEIAQRTLLWLRTTDVTLDYIRPTLPNTIHVGGLSTKPASALSPEFQDFADKSNEGLILVSFGSMADTLLDEMALKFLKAFGDLKQNVIWRFKNPNGLSIPKNVMITKWMPQNDLLAHPNVRVFITHCGNNGQFEALYFGVPMIGFPLLGDQPYNSKRMEYKGYGIDMSLFTFTSDELVTNINKVMTEPMYAENIKKASAIFRSRESTPVERATDMIEHVLTFGGDHLRPYSLQMPLYQYLMVDVIVIIFIVITIILCVIYKCVIMVCRKCCVNKHKQD